MKHIVIMILQVVLVANSLPALNDATAMELPDIVVLRFFFCGLPFVSQNSVNVVHQNSVNVHQNIER